MWTKIEIIPSNDIVMYLPVLLSTICGQTTIVNFGMISVRTDVQYTDELQLSEDSTFEKPIRIRITDKLKNMLLIQESLVYQVKISSECIAIGPVIGLLLGAHTHRYNPKHMEKYSDRFGIYNKVGGLIYAFSPKSVDWKTHRAYGLYFNIATASWEYGCFPLPEVIYRRDFHFSQKVIKKLSILTGGRLFNSIRYTKYELYKYISSNSELSRYLPPTELSLNYDQVKRFINRHNKVILKPVDLSRGRGICIIEKTGSIFKITDYRYKHPSVSILEGDEALEKFLHANQDLFNRYLVQKYLSLARIGSSLFDIRVVMQKKRDKTWGCTGIECRVSSSNSRLTNISRGGYALPLTEALRQAFNEGYESLPQQIEEFCKKFCFYMDQMGEHFAEFGMDIAVDTDKNIWLIESNVFPSFKGFKKMDRELYLLIRYTPILYALSLTQFG